jgi:hypothetical protein
VFCNETKYSLKLNDIDVDWTINSNYVINNILIKDYKSKLKNWVSDSVFQGEVFVKMISEYDDYSTLYYYYVSVVGRDGTSFSLLIHPKTAEILASNSIN